MFSERPIPLSEKVISTYFPLSSKEIRKIVAPALTELLAILSMIIPIEDFVLTIDSRVLLNQQVYGLSRSLVGFAPQWII